MDVRTHIEEDQKRIQIVLPVTQTIGALAITAATLLFDWEPWLIILMVSLIVAAWWIHLSQALTYVARIRIYGIMIAAELFFYGIHPTSIFDVSVTTAIVFGLYSMTEEKPVLNLILGTYGAIMLVQLINALRTGIVPDRLGVMRVLLHIVAVVMLYRIATMVIKKRSGDHKTYEQMMTEIEEISRRTDDFMTNVSHELRTPINAVTGITSILIKNETDPVKKTELEGVQRAGHRLFEQIGDILDYTEIDTKKIKLSEEIYMLSSVINDIQTEIQQISTEDFPEVIINIDPQTPSKLVGDGRRIKKIIRHLLDNSIKFTREGGVFLKVYTLKKEYGVNVCIEVTDTGIGITEEDRQRITSGFYQTDSGRSRRAGGIGLGLPIVYGFVHEMGGFARIESRPGEGTRVCISIPQKVVDDAPTISVNNAEDLCIAVYLRPEKYKVARVRDFYTEAINDFARGCSLHFHRVNNTLELEKLMDVYKVTHLFIGQDEYEENEGYFEYMDEDIKLIVSTDHDYTPKTGSRMLMMRKPFFGFAVANIFNAVNNEDGSFEGIEDKHPYFPGVRALVVDDEEMNLFVAKGIFSEYGMEVVTASGGQEAIDIFELEEFDVIFMDHMMPEMDGVEAMKIIRRRSRDMKRTPVMIALTANAVSGAREMFLEEGFDEFVAKPIEPTELERTLKKVMPVTMIQYRDKDEVSAFAGDEAEDLSEDDPIQELGKAGINIRSGLNYSRGDRNFYLELLRKFALDHDKKSSDIETDHANRDWSDYRIRIHALKSSSKMVGADQLSDLAFQLETAAKNGDDGFIAEHHEEMKRLYRDTALKFRAALGEEKESSDALEELDRAQFISRLNEITESLKTFEADKAENIIKELENYSIGGESIGKMLSGIRSLIGDFDMNAAAEELEKLISDEEK